MRGRAIAGLARTPRRSLIVLKLEKTCQLFVTYICKYMSTYSTGCLPHTRATYIFVLFCHVVFMAQCIQMQRGLEMETGKGKARNQNQNPKTEYQRQPKPQIHCQPLEQATQKRQRSRSRRRC